LFSYFSVTLSGQEGVLGLKHTNTKEKKHNQNPHVGEIKHLPEKAGYTFLSVPSSSEKWTTSLLSDSPDSGLLGEHGQLAVFMANVCFLIIISAEI